MAALRALGELLPALGRKARKMASGAVGNAVRKSTGKTAGQAAGKTVGTAARTTGKAARKAAIAKADSAVLGALERSAPAEIARAHASVLAKRPDLLKLKYQKMAENPFAFFRGSPGLFYSDLERIEGRKVASGARTVLVGDLHVENFGTLVERSGKVTFGMNDFDEAMLGPVRLDLQRMAASIVLAGKSAGLGPDKTHDLVRDFARRYTEVLGKAAEGASKGDKIKAKGLMKRFIKDASEADIGKWLDKLAPKVNGHRAFIRSKVVTSPRPEVARHLADAYSKYLEGLPGKAAQDLRDYQIKDAVSVVAGNASIGRGRYRLLLDAPGKRPIVLEIKEQVSSALTSVLSGSPAAVRSDAERVVRMTRAVRQKLNPFLGTTTMPASDGLGKGSYMVRRLYPTDQKLSADSFKGAEEFADFLDLAAARAAKAHARGQRVGGAGAAEILASLPTEKALSAELDAFGHKYALQAERDFNSFKRFLATDPLLRGLK